MMSHSRDFPGNDFLHQYGLITVSFKVSQRNTTIISSGKNNGIKTFFFPDKEQFNGRAIDQRLRGIRFVFHSLYEVLGSCYEKEPILKTRNLPYEYHRC